MKRLDLPVRGMDCPSCASHVRDALQRVDGVASARVLLAAAKAEVEYDESRIELTRLVEAVASAGYAVSPDVLEGRASAGRSGTAAGDPDRTGRADAFARRAMGLTGLVFGAVLLVVVAGEWLGLFEAATERIPFAVGVVIVVVVGWPAFRGVLRAALRRRVISHTLMTLGVVAALAIGQWVTAAVVAFFMRVGDFVEGFTVRRGRRALEELEALAPATARVEREGRQVEVPVTEVRPGDVVVVRPGERIPVDGEVVEGRAAVEQAAITGESVPVEVEPGASLFAATVVRGGALRVRTTRVGAEATFGRIVRMVEEAEANRGPVESFADRFSGWYLPVVATIALLVLVVRGDPLATAAVLVVACSCAFAIATPVAMLASIGASARGGLLVKGGAHLEALARADVVLVDKTGTSTVGHLTVGEVVPFGGASEEEVLALAAAAERDSEHPVAGAIRREAAYRGIEVGIPTAFRALEGLGVEATVGGRAVRVGSLRPGGAGAAAPPGAAATGGPGSPRGSPERAGAGPETATGTALLPEAGRLAAAGMTLARVDRDGEPIGILGLVDRVRSDAPAALAVLRELGIARIELLTGDHDAAAAPVADALGISYRAGLLPEDKIRIVREYQERGHTVVMIGDGVNDAPALAQADVGIAMGAAGTDLALEVADVALMRDDWSLVPQALRTARRTMGVVRGNFILTGLYNAVGLTLAAFGFLPPILAAAAQSIPDLGILGNSARLLRGARRG